VGCPAVAVGDQLRPPAFPRTADCDTPNPQSQMMQGVSGRRVRPDERSDHRRNVERRVRDGFDFMQQTVQ
jgi:hypothetical protein